MPIKIHAVSVADFTAWTAKAKQQFGADATPPGGSPQQFAANHVNHGQTERR